MRRSTLKRGPVEKFSRRPVGRVEKVQTFATELTGGVNEISGLLDFPQTDALFALNYAPAEGGGYELVGQLERFDGTSPPPREANYYGVPYTKLNRSNAFYLYAPCNGVSSSAEANYIPINCMSFKAGSEKIIPGSQLSLEVDTYDPIGGVTAKSTITIACRGIYVESGTWEGGDAQGTIFFDDLTASLDAYRALDGYRISGVGDTLGEAQLAYSSTAAGIYVPTVTLQNGATAEEIALNRAQTSNVYRIPFRLGTSNQNPYGSGGASFPEWFRPPCMIKSDVGHYFWLTDVEVTSGDPTTDDAAGYLYGIPFVAPYTDLTLASYFTGGGGVDVGGCLSGGVAVIDGPLESTGDFTSLEDADNDAVWKAKGVLPAFSWNGTEFTAGEDIDDGAGVVIAEVPSAPLSDDSGEGGLRTEFLDKVYRNYMGYQTRLGIQPVPGKGPVRGIFEYDGDIFAIRQKFTGTNLGFYKANGSLWSGITATPAPSDQWEEVEVYNTLKFYAGVDDFEIGDTVTGLTSGASATVIYVGATGGATGTGSLSGALTLGTITGGPFQDTEALQVSGATVALADGVVSTTFDGTNETPCEIIKANFGDGEKVYITTGGDDIAVYDGTKLSKISLGTTAQLGGGPTHLIEHKNYLFVSIGSSVFHSAVGDPRVFTALNNTVEFALGDEVTGFGKTAGGLLAMLTRDKTHVLYGAEVADWEKKEQPSRIGAIPKSIQPGVNPIFTDVQGITTLSAVQEFGDFRATELSKMVSRSLQRNINNIVASVKIKDTQQYWLFFSDGTGIIGYFGEENPRFTFFGYTSDYYETPDLDLTEVVLNSDYEDIIRPYVAFATDYIGGIERVFMGDQQGFVYEMNVGTSLDGAPLQGYLRLAPWNMKAPMLNKSFIKATVYVEAGEGSEVLASYELDYGDNSLERNRTNANELNNLSDVEPSGGYWGIDEWGQFSWGGRAVSEINIYIDAPSRNIGLLISSLSAVEPKHTIEGCVVEYILRGRKS